MRHSRSVTAAALTCATSSTLAVILTAVGFAFPCITEAADQLFVHTYEQDSKLMTIDADTGASTLIGPTGISFLADLALAPNGQLFAITVDTLYELDRFTGASTLIGSLGLTNNVMVGLEFAPDGQLYGVDQNAGGFFSISLTGTATLLFNTGFSFAGDVAHFNGDEFYGTAIFGDGSHLIRLDKSGSGSAIDLGLIAAGEIIYGLDFDSTNRLVGFSFSGNTYFIPNFASSGTGSFLSFSGVQVTGATGDTFEIIDPTPTATQTPIGTPTPTATPVPDHFQCYETHRPAFNQTGVSLVDQLGASTVTIKRNKRVCAPADKNGEDPNAPDHPGHHTSYTIKQTAPRFAVVSNVTVTNQFGDFVFDLTKPDRLLVPTAKDLIIAPPPLTVPMNHFKCYKVRGVKFRRSGLQIEDQFGALTVDLKRPTHLCLAADKNGEGVSDPTNHLLCYKDQVASGTASHPMLAQIFTNNQFGPDAYPVFGPRDFCIPSKLPRCGVHDDCIFVTSAPVPGDVGGLADADATCNTLAMGAGLPGTYKAWLSDSTTNAVSRLQLGGPYVGPTGVLVANDLADLTDGTLSSPINYFENGGQCGNCEVWTASTTGGNYFGTGACNDWTSALAADQARVGLSFATGSQWTMVSNQLCDRPNVRLYCIQQ